MNANKIKKLAYHILKKTQTKANQKAWKNKRKHHSSVSNGEKCNFASFD